MAYIAYVLTDESREKLLAIFPPKFPDIIAHHVTEKFGVKTCLTQGENVLITVVGYSSDDSIEAAVVKVKDQWFNSENRLYHVTLSLDRSKGMTPVRSNDLLKSIGWESIPKRFDLVGTTALLG